jgi:hypothetical protein
MNEGELGEMNVVSKWKQGPETPRPTRSLLADPERVFIFDCVRYSGTAGTKHTHTRH